MAKIPPQFLKNDKKNAAKAPAKAGAKPNPFAKAPAKAPMKGKKVMAGMSNAAGSKMAMAAGQRPAANTIKSVPIAPPIATKKS